MMATLSVVVTNHNYGRYLRQCLDSAFDYADEVLVYDDGSTDASLDIIAQYPDVRLTTRKDASGSPVWGSNLGIQDATGTHLMFLDSDNWLVSKPPCNAVDYTFAPILIRDADGNHVTVWEYSSFGLTAEWCRQRFIETHQIPFPWGGVWRTDFIRDKRWRHWEHTMMAADFRTAVDWLQDDPTLAYHRTPFLSFRDHSASWSNSGERDIMQADANAEACVMAARNV